MKGEKPKTEGQQRRGPLGRPALDKGACPGVKPGQKEQLNDTVRCRARRHRAEQFFAQRIQRAEEKRVEDGMRCFKLTGCELADFMLKVIDDNAGIKRKKHQQITRGQQQEERPAGNSPMLFRFGCGKGKSEGKQRADGRRGQAGNGQTAQKSAFAGKQAVINDKFTAQAQADGKDQTKRQPEAQSASAVRLQRVTNGEKRRENQNQRQNGRAKNRAVRIDRNQIWRRNRQHQREKDGKERRVFSKEIHRM